MEKMQQTMMKHYKMFAGLGLFIVALGKPSIPKIAVGGLLTGLGVNAMHYLGMAAMRLDGEIYTVAAVMPREFVFAPFWAVGAELWTPLPASSRSQDRGCMARGT